MADQVSKFSNSYQTEARKVPGTSDDDALKINNQYALLAFEIGVPADQASKISNPFQILLISQGTSIDDALKINDPYALLAFQIGAPADQASKFSNYFQIEALRVKGTSVDDALKINNQYALLAFETGKVTANQAPQFSSFFQIDALKNGIIIGAFDPSKINDSDVIIGAEQKLKISTLQKATPLKIFNAYIIIAEQKLKITPQKEASAFDLIVGANQISNFDNPDQFMSGMNDIVIDA